MRVVTCVQKGRKMVAKERSESDEGEAKEERSDEDSWLFEEDALRRPGLISERRVAKNGEARASKVLLVNT